MLSRLLPVLTLLVAFATAPAFAQNTEVDVELMLAVDVSYSMTPNELEIQRRGYAEALRDPKIIEAIRTGYRQQVAMTYVEWSGHLSQRVIVPWTLISTPEDLDRFASRLTAEFQPILRRTSISGVLDWAPLSFETNDFNGERRVIDVSGDGPNNDGRPVVPARDELIAQGYAINGLPLMTRENIGGGRFHLDDLDLYYRNCVIGGLGAFVIPVKSWEEFPAAVRRKLVLELASPDVPRIWRAQWRGAQPDGGYDCLVGEKMWLWFLQQYPELDGWP